MTSRKNPPLNF